VLSLLVFSVSDQNPAAMINLGVVIAWTVGYGAVALSEALKERPVPVTSAGAGSGVGGREKSRRVLQEARSRGGSQVSGHSASSREKRSN